MLSGFYKIRLGRPKLEVSPETVINSKKRMAGWHYRRMEEADKKSDYHRKQWEALEREACDLEDGNA